MLRGHSKKIIRGRRLIQEDFLWEENDGEDTEQSVGDAGHVAGTIEPASPWGPHEGGNPTQAGLLGAVLRGHSGDAQAPALNDTANPEAFSTSGPAFSGVTLTHEDTLGTDTFPNHVSGSMLCSPGIFHSTHARTAPASPSHPSAGSPLPGHRRPSRPLVCCCL